MEPLLTVDDTLVSGTVVDRPNRFVVRVRFADTPERVFLGDPGALEGILEPGREILCSPVDDSDRATDYDAIAVHVDGTYVSLRTALANDLFERVLARDALPAFAEYTLRRREPNLPDHGRTDFLLATPAGDPVYRRSRPSASGLDREGEGRKLG
jgi:sugar fermentation stimulation protein A